MEQLLSVSIHEILQKNVRQTITYLYSFFSSIYSKAIDPIKLGELQGEIVIILCQLEMFFPLSFFDIIVHLLIHLEREIKFYGPESSMIEKNIAKESIEFYSKYMTKENPIRVPPRSWLNRCFISKCL